MKDRLIHLKEVLEYIGIKTIVLALLALLTVTAIAAFIGNHTYATEMQVLQQQGELNAKESAIEYSHYLHTRSDIITLIGYTVNDMLTNGADNEAILKYLTDETNYIIASLDPETTGLYGWFNNDYLDGSGWVPDPDYVATERPWYKETLKSNEKITFVEPYLDAETGTVMMTVSALMSDDESVVAMDVSLDEVQHIVENVAAETEGSQALVINEDGIVVAHSDKSQLGKNYLNETGTLGSLVATKLLKEGLTQFDVDTKEGKFSVYCNDLEGRWYSVSLINADIWYKPLQWTTLIFSLIAIVMVVFLIFVFLRLNAKNLELRKMHNKITQEEKRSDELQILSETDRMTGLLDRVSGKSKVDELLSAGSEGMFLELDIDNFKNFNDTYGHQVGDEVILAVADAIKNTFRTNDVTMRLGGDEFGVFAVGIVDENMGEAITNRLFYVLDKKEIEQLNGKKINISVGARLCRKEEGADFDKLYADADAAMYESKKSKGNSLTFA